MPHRAALSRADVRDMRLGEYVRSTRAVHYRCMGCGGVDTLDPHDYGIAANGDVKPQYVCPIETCRLAVSLRLVGWKPWDTSDCGGGG